MITAQEKSLLETRPQASKLWLSIYQPDTILACRVNDAGAGRGDRVITYDGVTEGSHVLVESGMVMLVGSTLGACDKGRIRTRSADASEITVAANDDINWADDDYITILNFIEINPVYPRIIQDPSNATNTLWYKDYDIAYTDQNSVLGSFINMGPHHAAFLDNGSVDVYYSASGTVNLKSEAMTYDWWFQGGTVTGSSAHTPGNITYTSPGHYTTRLNVTTGGGADDTAYRHISIYDKPGEGSSTPILKWNLKDLSGDRNSGGYTSTVVIRDDVSRSIITDGALVVIFQESWYGNTKQNIGGNALNRSDIVFTGYIIDGSIEYDYRDGSVEFEITNSTGVMQSLDCPSISVTSSTNPAAQAASDENYPSGWTLVQSLDVRRAIYHYLRWHSTVLLCNDFEFGGDDQNIRHFESDRASLYDAINTLMQDRLVGSLVCDRQGKLWAEVGVSATDSAATSFQTDPLAINRSHWIGAPTIEETQVAELSYLEMGGIQYDGPSADTFEALLAEFPGRNPGRRGNYENGNATLALASQAQLNTLCGNVYAHRNRRYPASSYRLAGHYLNFDIAPITLLDITLDTNDTPRGISFSGKKFSVEGMSWAYNSRSESLLPTVTVSEITQGIDAETVTIPDVPPVSPVDPGGGGVGQLEISVPSLPAPLLPSITVGTVKSFACTYVPLEDESSETNLQISGVFRTTDEISSTTYAVKADAVGIYLVTTFLTAFREDDTAFTVDIAFSPCVGFITGDRMFSGGLGLNFLTRAQMVSHVQTVGSDYSFASLSLSYPVFVHTNNVGATLSDITITPSVMVAGLNASTSVIKLNDVSPSFYVCDQTS